MMFYMPTELEFRGPLTKNRFDELDRKLRRLSKNHKKLSRLSMIYFSPGFNRRTIIHSKMDVRLRINNRKPELVMKTGRSDSNDRDEFTIEIAPSSFFDTVAFLSSLGFTSGFVQEQSKHLYDYKGIEIDLGYVNGFGYYFEIEKVIHDKKGAAPAKKDINKLCKDLGLRFYEKKEYERAIKRLDMMQNSFDLRQTSISTITKSNPNYFKEINAACSKLKKRENYVYRY